MITVDGDSMEPLLSSGDRILIDVSRQVPVPPGIFVIWDGMGLVAKRIEHVPHSEPPKVVLRSLNPEYDSYERLAEEIRVVGRAGLGLQETVGHGRRRINPPGLGATSRQSAAKHAMTPWVGVASIGTAPHA